MRFWSTLKKKITNELRAWGGLLSPIVSTLSQGLRIIFERKTSLEQKARRLGEVWRGAGWENYRVDNIRHNFTASGTMLLLSLLVPPVLGLTWVLQYTVVGTYCYQLLTLVRMYIHSFFYQV